MDNVEIRVDDYVVGGLGRGADYGRVLKVDGNDVLIGWKAGVVTTIDITSEDYEVYTSGSQCSAEMDYLARRVVRPENAHR